MSSSVARDWPPNKRLLLSAPATEAAGSLRSLAASLDNAPQQKRMRYADDDPTHCAFNDQLRYAERVCRCATRWHLGWHLGWPSLGRLQADGGGSSVPGPRCIL
jgi:hypothetical protein